MFAHGDRALYNLHVDRIRAVLDAAVARRQGDEAKRAVAVAQRAQLDQTLSALADARSRAGWLARTCGLSADATDFAWTAVAVASDPLVLSLALAVTSEARRGVTPAFFCEAFQLDGVRSRDLVTELEAARPLVRLRLLAPSEDKWVRPGTAFTAPSRVIGFLRGDDEIDPLVARVGGVVAPAADLVVDAAQADAVRELERTLDTDEPRLCLIEGPRGAGRKTAVASVAAQLGRPVVALHLDRWDAAIASLDDTIAAWRRECLLLRAVPVLADIDALTPADLRRVGLLVDDGPPIIVATAGRPGLNLGCRRPLVRVRYPAPDAAARRQLWQARVAGDEIDLDRLARRFRMGAGGIGRAIDAARAAHDPDAPLDTAALTRGVRASLTDRLGDLVTRVDVTQSWDDLVLPEDVHKQVFALVARVRFGHQVLDRWGFQARFPRGQGIAALLSGPPGTGKTMVAGLLARELGLDLLQVDLSRVVSKWIGETEKQLGQVFDAAEAGQSLLLFDEADALFAKRTEVKGSNDRYANMEVNYLLQRIEAFGGVVVLTTNFDTGIDPALKRRLAAHIAFATPDDDERERLWRHMIPPAAPIEGELDARALARAFPDMTGANIRNAAIAGAFLAAAEGRSITQDHLEQAARGEYHAMGRVLAGRSRHAA